MLVILSDGRFLYSNRLQVNDLLEASKSISTLPSMVELAVRVASSHARNLLRIKRAIDMVKVLFRQILVTE